MVEDKEMYAAYVCVFYIFIRSRRREAVVFATSSSRVSPMNGRLFFLFSFSSFTLASAVCLTTGILHSLSICVPLFSYYILDVHSCLFLVVCSGCQYRASFCGLARCILCVDNCASGEHYGCMELC